MHQSQPNPSTDVAHDPLGQEQQAAPNILVTPSDHEVVQELQAAANTTRADQDEAPEKGPLRKCLGSGQLFSKQDLVRFVISPDGIIVPDVSQRLPGRGIWISPNKAMIETAVAKRAFTRSAKRNVTVPSDLLAQTIQLYRAQILSRLGLMRRSGSLVLGYEKVKASLDKQPNKFKYWSSQDASTSSISKMKHISQGPLPYTSEELGANFGRANTTFLGTSIAGQIASVMRLLYHLDTLQPAVKPAIDMTSAGSGKILTAPASKASSDTDRASVVIEPSQTTSD